MVARKHGFERIHYIERVDPKLLSTHHPAFHPTKWVGLMCVRISPLELHMLFISEYIWMQSNKRLIGTRKLSVIFIYSLLVVIFPKKKLRDMRRTYIIHYKSRLTIMYDRTTMESIDCKCFKLEGKISWHISMIIVTALSTKAHNRDHGWSISRLNFG